MQLPAAAATAVSFAAAAEGHKLPVLGPVAAGSFAGSVQSVPLAEQ